MDLFHIRSERLIRGAESKGQCAKDYFYGADLILEKALQEPEGHYARVVRALIDGAGPSQDELQALLVFFLLQSFRSYGQVERTMTMGKMITADHIKGGVVEPTEFLEEWQEAVTFLLRTALQIGMDGHVEGLRLVIGRATGGAQFITSDDPAIHVNRYHSQRLKEASYGYGNTGLMFFLPLSPDLVFLAFDPHCYRCAYGKIVDVDPASAAAINHLQMVFARNTLYLPPGSDEGHFREMFESSRSLRPKIWSRKTFLIEDGGRKGTFVAVPEMPETGSFMQHLEMVKPTPANWPRMLSFKHKIKSNRTGTAAGDLRPDYDSAKIHWKEIERSLGL